MCARPGVQTRPPSASNLQSVLGLAGRGRRRYARLLPHRGHLPVALSSASSVVVPGMSSTHVIMPAPPWPPARFIGQSAASSRRNAISGCCGPDCCRDVGKVGFADAARWIQAQNVNPAGSIQPSAGCHMRRPPLPPSIARYRFSHGRRPGQSGGWCNRWFPRTATDGSRRGRDVT